MKNVRFIITFNKKEQEVLELIGKETSVYLNDGEERTCYDITIWGKGRAKALTSALAKIGIKFD